MHWTSFGLLIEWRSCGLFLNDNKFMNYKLESDDVGSAIFCEILNIGCVGCFVYKHHLKVASMK